MNKEKWIDEILQSGKNISPVEGDPWLASKVEARLLKNNEAVKIKMPLNWVYATSVAMLLILFVNVFVWGKSVKGSRTKEVQLLMHDYGFSHNDIYSVDYSN